MINPMDLTGKTFLVTGASSGMGKQVCITLSKLGARVVLVARNEKRLQETLNLMDSPEIHLIESFDLSNLDKIEDMVRRTSSKIGKFDGFCHCAGLGTMKPLLATTPDFMEEMMTVNLYSFIEITRCITKKKFCNANMNIVAISSAASIRGDKYVWRVNRSGGIYGDINANHGSVGVRPVITVGKKLSPYTCHGNLKETTFNYILYWLLYHGIFRILWKKINH